MAYVFKKTLLSYYYLIIRSTRKSAVTTTVGVLKKRHGYDGVLTKTLSITELWPIRMCARRPGTDIF